MRVERLGFEGGGPEQLGPPLFFIPAARRQSPGMSPGAPGLVHPSVSREEDLAVFGEVLEGYTEAHLRHYRFCRCHSVACPEGELGDVHVSTVLCLVSRAFFEAMRQEGWQMEAGPLPRSACRKKEGERPAAGEARADITSHRSSQGACGPRACPGGGPLPGRPTASSAAGTCRTPRSRSSAPRRRRACRSPLPKGRAWRAGP